MIFVFWKKNKTTSTKNKNILTIEEYSGLKINATYFYILDPCFLLIDNGSEFHFLNVPYMYQKNFISTWILNQSFDFLMKMVRFVRWIEQRKL